MDPFLALGLAGNIIQFIDFATKIIRAAADIHSSVAGVAQDDNDIITSTARLETFLSRLEISKPASRLNDEEIELNVLASECKKMSEDLLKSVKELQASDPTSKRQSLGAALKSAWKKPEKDRMERRLENCKSTLVLYLSDLARSETMERLNRIANSGRSTEAELASLNRNVKALRSGLKVSCINPAALDQIRNAVRLSDEADQRVRTFRILKGLRFDGVNDRFENVAEAHGSTFHWILQDDSEFELDGPCCRDHAGHFAEVDLKVRKTARNQLAEWLEHGSGVLRFSGKPGSGKSTLMKFLYNQPKTRQLLLSWAGEKELVMSHFFFWNPGAELQKSWKGLLRGLLFTLLSRSPKLLPLLVPEQWEAAALHDIHFEDDAIQQAFDKLLVERPIHEKHKFVFFIDGLDEFAGDHLTMVRRFAAWMNLQGATIKLCVSSREWPVFEEGFKRYPKVQLHTVTRTDICRFVRSRLEENREVTGFDQLPFKGVTLNRIISKADGVFIWVSLILRQVEDGLVNGDGPQDLQRKIDSLPTELEDMFTHLLDSVPLADRRKSYAMLLFMREMGHIGRETTLLRLSFLEDYLDCESVDSIDSTKLLSEEEILHRLSRTRKRVYGLCKGLLDVTSPTLLLVVEMITRRESMMQQVRSILGSDQFQKINWDDSGYLLLKSGLPAEPISISSALKQVSDRIYREMVGFNHRSIVEFLQTRRASVRLSEATVGFDFFTAWQHGVVSQLRAVNIIRPLHSRWDYCQTWSPNHGYDVVDWELRAMIHWAIASAQRAVTRQMCVFFHRAVAATEASGFPRGNLEIQGPHRSASDWEKREPPAKFELSMSEMIDLLCLQTGFHEYLTWKNKRHFNLAQKHIRLWMLTSQISHGDVSSVSSLGKNWRRLARSIDVILADGIVSPNEAQHGTDISCFFYLVLRFITKLPAILPIIALFLYHGVDPRFRITFQQRWKSLMGRSRCLAVTISGGPDMTPIAFKGATSWVACVTTLPREFLEKNNWSLTLRDMVGLWFPGHAGQQLQEFIDWRCLHPANLPETTTAELRTRFGKPLRDLFERGMSTAADPAWYLGFRPGPGFELSQSETRLEDMRDATQQDWSADGRGTYRQILWRELFDGSS